MERRLFQMLCLAATALSWFVVIPGNLIQGLPRLLSVVVFLFGAASLGFFWASTRGRDHLKAFNLVAVLVLNLCWFTNAGSQGSIGMFFFAGVMVPAIFFRGIQRVLFVLAFVLDIVLLLSLDHLHPTWSVPYPTPMDRYLDLVTGFLASATACLLMLWVVVSSHDQERKRLQSANAELKKSLAEIRTLQGMLPICCWCKKIRDDDGLWTQVELYFAERSDLSFTHGMCPECAAQHFPSMEPEDGELTGA